MEVANSTSSAGPQARASATARIHPFVRLSSRYTLHGSFAVQDYLRIGEAV